MDMLICNSCQNEYDVKDINNINQCVYGLTASFLETDNVYNVVNNNITGEMCKQCVNQSIAALGKKPIDLRIQPPPILNSDLYLFNKIAKNKLNENMFNSDSTVNSVLDKSYDQCLQDCLNTREPNTCKKYCKLARNSLNYVQPPPDVKENYEKDSVCSDVYKYLILILLILFMYLIFNK